MPRKEALEDTLKLVDAIIGKVNEMGEYAEKEKALDAVYSKYLRKERQ